MQNGGGCDEALCPRCSEGGPGGTFDSDDVRCSAIKHRAPPKASSTLGRWRGGQLRKAAEAGPANAWVLDEWLGEDVEIYTCPKACNDGLIDGHNLTMAKIVYFFQHEGNRRAGEADDSPGPSSEWVLVYEYCTDSSQGDGVQTPAPTPDTTTLHPLYSLRATRSCRPSTYPITAIRKHVLCTHACSEGVCGVEKRDRG